MRIRLLNSLQSLACAALLVIGTLGSSAVHAQGVCAEVRIEIKQKISLERQAFDASLKIRNGLSTVTVEDVSVNLVFKDSTGATVIASSDPNTPNASFFVRQDELINITNVTGTGSVARTTTAEARWLIIPTVGAAEQSPTGALYTVGATISYRMGTEVRTADVLPESITVKPQPQLELDYFLAGDVYADDPFTAPIEPSEPFTLGVRVKNTGFGPANAMTIDSAQPRIVENTQGLLINFLIDHSFVDDAPAQPTLLVDFGTVAAGASKMGRWLMSTTLTGRFVEFDAEFTHAPELGGALTSLITRVDTHSLLSDVLVDLPGRDSIRDFLALDADIVRVYESSGVDTLVPDRSSTAVVVPLGGTQVQMTVPGSGMFFARMTDPFAGLARSITVTRGNGTPLPTGNAWFSKKRNQDLSWSYYLNLFDTAPSGNYTGTATLQIPPGAAVQGVVYNDLNGNGAQNPGEAGLPGVPVTLSNTASGGAFNTTIATTASGTFSYFNLSAGTYDLSVGALAGFGNGLHAVGTAGGTVVAGGIQQIVLAANTNATGYLLAKRALAATTTAITAITPALSQTAGIPYTVSASVSGSASPTGTVMVTDGDGNSCTITLPGSNCALTSTVVGAKTITATYGGDASNAGSSDTESYAITANPNNSAGLQVGSVTLPPTLPAPAVNTPVTVTFAQAFNAIPVIIVQPSDEDADPQAVRIRNVTTTGFELLQVEPPGCIGCTGAGGTMTVHWLAAMPGSYRLTQDTTVAPAWALTPQRGSGPGALLKVGAITTTATQYNSLVGGFGGWPLPSWDSVSWPALGNGLDFSSAPVVLTSIQSWNNEGANLTGAGLVGPSQPWATSVARNVGASGFEVAIEASEVSADDLPPPGFAVGESIGYVAIEGDVSQLLLPLGGPPYVGLVTATAAASGACTSSDHQFPAATPIDAANFKAFGGKQTRNAAAGGWLRRCLLSNPAGTTVSVGMRVEEDRFVDAPSGTPADTAGLTAFSGSFLTTPVTLAKMGVARRGDSLLVSWSTTHEVGQIGFRLWGRSGPAGDWQLLTPNLIASAAEETRQARSYEHTVSAAAAIGEVRIEDVDVVGASRFHPAVAVGSSRGDDPLDSPVDWSAIRANNSQTSVARASPQVATALAQVSVDGVQRVAVADLIARDSRFDGQPAASLALLDGTAPIPRHVSCAVLQSGCWIEFLGVSRASRYGADNTYTVTLDASAARPVDSGHAQVGSGALHVITDHVLHYPNRAFNSSAPADDPWLDERLVASNGPAQLTRSFALPELAPGPVQLTVDVWGGLDFPDLPPDHHVQILVNGQVLADRRFDSFIAERIEVAVPESLLTASNTLALRLPRDTGYSVDIVMLDGFKVSYSRRTRVSNGMLVQGIIDPTAVSVGIGEFRDGFESAPPPAATFQIDGQVSGAVLWSVIDGEIRRDELTATPFLLPITSSGWHLADPAAIRTPTLALPAEPYVLPAQVDYVVITHPLFESGLAPLLALQASRGLSTAVLRTDAIYAAHSDHARDPQAIKTAIAAAKLRGARFVLLVGGDSIDYHDYLGSGSQSYLPTWYTQSSRYIFHAATDHPYADLTGDERPELAIGRLPVRTTTELTRAITSITARGNSLPQRYLAVAGVSNPGEHFALHSRAILGYLRQPGQQRDYALADEIGTAAAKARARDGLGGSADWVNYLGHSSANRWAFDNLLDVSQLASITRTGAPAIVSQWSCWNNDFTAPTQDTMAHALMLRSNRLAAAVLGATSLAEDASHLALGTRFFDIVEDGRLGDFGGLPIRTLGEALQAAKADLLQREPAHRSAAYTIVLFGDPAAPLQ